MHIFIEKCIKRYEKLGHCLCAGIDPDLKKLPKDYKKDLVGLKKYLDDYISYSKNYVIAYKPNLSFFEALGINGLQLLKDLIKSINSDIPVILDAKRGDIGNTSEMQASYIYDFFEADATTLHPYMGSDSLIPFFNYKDKFNFVLCITSNPSATEIECLSLSTKDPLYKEVYNQCLDWNDRYKNIGVVVGATKDQMIDLRKYDDSLLYLIPGVGTQGGQYKQSYFNGKNSLNLCLINTSRSLMYPADTFSEKTVAATIQSLVSI